MARLDLEHLYHSSLPEPIRPYIGLWKESFPSEISRLETVYSATDYLAGLARLPGTEMRPHTFTGYWGAARDRIPGTGWDAFEESSNEQLKEENDRRHQPETDQKKKKPL